MLFNTTHHAEGTEFQDASQVLVKVNKFQLTGKMGSEQCSNSESVSREVTNREVGSELLSSLDSQISRKLLITDSNTFWNKVAFAKVPSCAAFQT